VSCDVIIKKEGAETPKCSYKQHRDGVMKDVALKV
jgi:hypothetical protein